VAVGSRWTSGASSDWDSPILHPSYGLGQWRAWLTRPYAHPVPLLSRAEKARFDRSHVIDAESGCWLWTGDLTPNGYGRWRKGPGQPREMAHRTSYEHWVGPIPEGMTLDHLCRTRNCVRPDHLEPVTPSENTMRQDHHARNRTHCPKGHPYDDANTYTDPAGKRRCRACARK